VNLAHLARDFYVFRAYKSRWVVCCIGIPTPAGGTVLDDEKAATWDGNLRRLSMRAWREESDVAAIMTVRDGDAAGWINLKHVHPDQARMVWLRLRHSATMKTMDVLYAEDLAELKVRHTPETD
jgi:hypothetical protein